MPKEGMKRPDPQEVGGPKKKRNKQRPVPELQGKVKTGKKKAKPE